MERMPPTWFLELPVIRRHLSKRDYKLMNYSSTVARQNNSIRKAKADIFEQAGDDLGVLRWNLVTIYLHS